MTKQNSKEIEKPWAVFGRFFDNFGKIVEDSKNSCYIQYCEGQMYPPELWDSNRVKKFDNPLESINYFFEHNSDYENKKKVIEIFLRNFPSERKNLKKLLAQSQPKCTREDCRNLGDYMGRASHPIPD